MFKCAFLFLATAWSVLAAPEPFRVSLLDDDILHVQTATVDGNFTRELQAAVPTNRISGTVLDLRFAGGSQPADTDYFSRQKTPLVILVNGETRGAAATLADELRSAHRAILIGSTNPPGAVTPDIALAVGAGAEKTFQKNPFGEPVAGDRAPALANDFLPFIDHTSEADLVRRHVKDGEPEAGGNVPPEPPPPVIRDPALARALDLLKALAILRPGPPGLPVDSD